MTRILKYSAGVAALVAVPFLVSMPAASAAPTCLGQPATLVGTGGNNTLNGTAGVDVIMGMAGNDTINGLGGNDLLCGGKGTDTMNGGTGNDRLGGGPAADQLRGNENDDDLIGDGGNDVLDGGTHNSGHSAFDEAVYETSPNPITANLTTGTATGQGTDTFIGVESLTGSAFSDRLTGNSISLNYLTGGGGSDIIDGEPVGSGFGGDDMVSGGAGNDTMRGGPNLSGEGDTVSYYSSPDRRRSSIFSRRPRPERATTRSSGSSRSTARRTATTCSATAGTTRSSASAGATTSSATMAPTPSTSWTATATTPSLGASGRTTAPADAGDVRPGLPLIPLGRPLNIDEAAGRSPGLRLHRVEVVALRLSRCRTAGTGR